MSYTPRPPANIDSVDDLGRYLTAELDAIARSQTQVQELYFGAVGRAPDKLRDGVVVYADGVNFNPGSGAGLYERRGGSWFKL